MKVRWLVATLFIASTGIAAAQQGQVPTTETALGSVRIPRTVKADGKDLRAGTYQVRLTAQDASPAVPGIKMERWVEFVQGGKVAGREVASIIPGDEVKDTQPGPDLPGKQPGQAAPRRLARRYVEGRRIPPRVDHARRRSVFNSLTAGLSFLPGLRPGD
jgi:hypothetical protein